MLLEEKNGRTETNPKHRHIYEILIGVISEAVLPVRELQFT